MVAGGFGEAYIPSKLIVSGDAAATARNIRASDLLFRLAFAVYLIEAVCDIALSLIFYMLLKPVRKDVALLAAFFGLVSTALFGVAPVKHYDDYVKYEIDDPPFVLSLKPKRACAGGAA